MYSRHPQQSLLVRPSAHATCVGRTEHPQALKYMYSCETLQIKYIYKIHNVYNIYVHIVF